MGEALPTSFVALAESLACRLAIVVVAVVAVAAQWAQFGRWRLLALSGLGLAHAGFESTVVSPTDSVGISSSNSSSSVTSSSGGRVRSQSDTSAAAKATASGETISGLRAAPPCCCGGKPLRMAGIHIYQRRPQHSPQMLRALRTRPPLPLPLRTRTRPLLGRASTHPVAEAVAVALARWSGVSLPCDSPWGCLRRRATPAPSNA